MAAEGEVPSCLSLGCLGFLFSLGFDFSLVCRWECAYMCVHMCVRALSALKKYSESGENKNRGFKNIDVPICRNTFCQILWGAH